MGLAQTTEKQSEDSESLLSIVKRTPEMELLVFFCRHDSSGAVNDLIVEKLQSGVDFPRLIELAARHRLTGFLNRAFREHHELVAEQYRTELRNRTIWQSMRNLGMVGELIRILSRFAKENIPVAPYKGPVLTERLYGSVAMRPMQDLDILIRRSDLPRIEAALLSLDYEPTQTLSRFGKWYKDRTAHHAAWRRKSDGLLVELHWGVVRNTMAFKPDITGLIGRAAEESWRGLNLRRIPDEEMFIFLCVHGTGHRWMALEWLAMVGHFCSQTPALDWARLCDYAEVTGVRRELDLSLILLVELLATPVPRWIFEKAKENRAANLLARRCVAGFISPRSGLQKLADFGFMISLKSGCRNKLRYLAVEGLEILIFPLIYPNRSLSPVATVLSLLLRPFRLLGRLAGSGK